MISELDLEVTRFRNPQTFGRGIGNGKGVRTPASRSMRNVRGHSEVHGVAHLYALTVHIHVIHPGELERLVGRIRVLRVELAFSRDVALTGRRIGRNPQIGQSIDGGGHHSRSPRRHSRFASLGERILHQIPAFSVHIDRLARICLILGYGQASTIRSCRRSNPSQGLGEDTELIRSERRHIGGWIILVLCRDAVVASISHVSSGGHSSLPCVNRFHFDRAIARILERGKLVWRVRMAFLCVVNLQQWSIISLCGGDADGHAAQQRCRGGQPCEKLPHLHENLLFLDCWLLCSAIAGGGNPTCPRDPQILCCSAEPLLASPLVGRSDGEQCQHANSAGRNLPPSFRTHAARQWQ